MNLETIFKSGKFSIQVVFYFQRLRESVKPVLKKHQLVPGQYLMKVMVGCVEA